MDKIDLLTFDIFKDFKEKLTCIVTTKNGGVSENSYSSLNLGFGVGDFEENVFENYKILGKSLEINESNIVRTLQTHSDNIFLVNNCDLGLENEVKNVDALVTRLKNVPISVRFADCQGVFIFDPVKEAIAVIHSGWRGNVQNIAGKTIEFMKEEFGSCSKDLLVSVSPSLGKEKAVFSSPYQELPDFMHQYIFDKKKVDLWKCLEDQLTDAGVLKENIENPRICTYSNPDRFFSFRFWKERGKETGRMLGLMMLK